MKFGMIGLGSISERFARVLGTVPGAELTAVAARELTRAEQFAQKHHAARAYGSYEELVNDDEVEGVYIGLTHNLHYQAAKLCVEHGKAVLCEKPFFICATDGRALFKLAEKSNVTVMEAMWSRCLPAYQKALQWTRQKQFGELRLIEASFSFNFNGPPTHRLYNPQLSGGALLDAGVYPLMFALDMAGAALKTAEGTVTKAPSGVDSLDVMSLRFENDVLAALSAGINVQTSTDAKLFGTQGYVVVYDFLRTTRCERFNSLGVLQESFECPCTDGFVYQIEHFMALYQEKKLESPLIPWKDTIACAEIFDLFRSKWDLQV